MTYDIIIISGDTYVDHPSFGAALIRRYLEKHGFSVGVIDQPRHVAAIQTLGKPRLFFAVTAGNLDSMVANYTADKKVRRNDMYSPNNEAGHRPDRACIVYTNKLKQAFPGAPIILGGVEASLRRFAHYDFWDDKVRRSILFDSKADMIAYGMSENAIVEIAQRAQDTCTEQSRGVAPQHGIPNTCIITRDVSPYATALRIPSYEEVSTDKNKFAEAHRLYTTELCKKHPRTIIQPCLPAGKAGQGRYLVVFPPKPLLQKDFESIFKLPFTRKSEKNVPAYDFVKFSTISHRGCFGGCSFCAINQHQGKYILSRGIESIKEEVQDIIMKQPDFKGQILDIGGPSANMYQMTCTKKDGCSRRSCIYLPDRRPGDVTQPSICKHLNSSHKPLLQLLRELRGIPGIKNVYINSGIRYDLAMTDPEYTEEIIKYHISGQLSVAPEHICEEVLLLMGKPKYSVYEKFQKEFNRLTKKAGKKQYLIPYLIASHPGSTLEHALEMALFLKKNHIRVQQVQNFTPTPMTTSTCMYYTGIDPFTGKNVHVPKSEERSMQRALLQPHTAKNYRIVAKALIKLQKQDLVKFLTSNPDI
ncbi:MAG: YgiQ family radical SAM protein [Candidatus Margulisiibacteriota bacterium]